MRSSTSESVQSQFSPFFTLTVARVPCYEMSRAYHWPTTELVGFCEYRQSRAVLKNSQRLTSSWTPIRVRVSKLRFWFRFWSRSCVIPVSTDSQKKSWKEKPIDEDLVDSTGLMEKLRKRRSTAGTGTQTSTNSNLLVELPSSNKRSPHGYCDDRENIWCWRGFFH